MIAKSDFSMPRGDLRRGGFTLVELLIVISIIGVLVALLMPAVNSARESGRRTQCASNLRQMALACLALESKQQHLPGGGWSWGWAGDPDRGFGKGQPGGWHYNILPFIDQADLHDLGKGTSNFNDHSTSNARAIAGQQIARTPVAMFICPTRRKVQVYPRNHPSSFINIAEPKPIIARSDYAANSGSNMNDATKYASDGAYDPNYDWSQETGTTNSTSEPATGVIYRASQLPMSWIKDGPEYTYLLGERYLCIDAYYTASSCDNDQGWDMGYDYDTNRGTKLPPMQDRSGYTGCMTLFGSAHPAGFHMAFCDGSVAKINYDINPTFHMQLGHRSDGQPTQLQGITQSKGG